MSSELMPGENLVLKEHQHWIVMIKPLLLPIALVVLVLLLDLFKTIPSDYRLLSTLVVVAILGLALIAVWVGWNSRSFTVTDRRVILDTGVVSRASKVIALDRVQDISTNQSLLGRMLGYGRIEIDSAGASGAEVLSALPQPQRFRDEVFSRAEKLRTAGAGGESPAAAPPSV
jgi:uncharacterized membrane protein YdbT with pleckstrin-like domain